MKDKKQPGAAHIYSRESQWLERVKSIQAVPSISKGDLIKEYIELGSEYEKLLKQAIKITRIGDTHQRKLLLANEQIEKQKEELSIAYKKMEILARTDPLTQLSNRRDFLEKFQQEINRYDRNPKPFSLVLGDIDDFKQVNDRYGHDCGDFVLVTIAKMLRVMVRKQDIVGRWGGEEFILLLPEAPLEGGFVVAEGIRKRVAAETFSFKGHRLAVTVTFGVSEYEKEMDMDTCIKQADDALYSGKRTGKNRVIKHNEIPNHEKK
jgi:diguanylate cyclase (GGDEF)-like protein